MSKNSSATNVDFQLCCKIMTFTSRGILTYLLLVFTLSLGPYLLVIHAQHLAVGFGLVIGVLMWMPATAAFLTCRILGIDIASLGWNWRPIRFEVLAYVLPVLYALPVYIACWTLVPHSYVFPEFAREIGTAFGFPGSPMTATFLLGLPVFATFGIVRSIASALGEEIGWRGFLLPRLTGKFGWRIGCLISGCIWAVWHYPLLLFADYNSGTPKPFALTCFTLMVIADAYILGWLRLRSKSLWPCAMLHASHNLFIQAIFDRSTAQSGQALYVTTEFGFGLVLTAAITAFFLWRSSKPEQDAGVLQQETAAA
jgi:membrane protease YdiL (CAAX protease family)